MRIIPHLSDDESSEVNAGPTPLHQNDPTLQHREVSGECHPESSSEDRLARVFQVLSTDWRSVVGNHLSEDEVCDIVDVQLRDARRKAVEEHLALCADCRSRVEELRIYAQEWAARPLVLPEEL